MDNKKIYQIEGFDEEKETREVGAILGRFYKSYATKSQDLDIQDWLFTRLKEELPDYKDSDIERISQEIVNGVCNFDEDLKSLNESLKKGYSKEKWLSKSLEQASVDLDINEYGNYLADIYKNLSLNNAQAMNDIMDESGENSVNADLTNNQDLEWDIYSTKAFALNVAEQVALSGVIGICIGTDAYIDPQSFTNNDPEVQDFVSDSIESGIDFDLKVLITGVIDVATENGFFPFLKDKPAEILAGIACSVVEGCKTAWKFVNGEISAYKALDIMECVAIAQLKGVVNTLLKKENCEKIGETIGLLFGSEGMIAGKIVGKVISNLAHTGLGNALYEGAKKIAEPAVDYVKNCWQSIKNSAGKWLDNTRKTVSNGLKKVKASRSYC